MFECLDEVTDCAEGEIQTALEASEWNVEKAVQTLKIDKLMKLPVWKFGLKQNPVVCKMVLCSVEWNVDRAFQCVSGKQQVNTRKMPLQLSTPCPPSTSSPPSSLAPPTYSATIDAPSLTSSRLAQPLDPSIGQLSQSSQETQIKDVVIDTIHEIKEQKVKFLRIELIISCIFFFRRALPPSACVTWSKRSLGSRSRSEIKRS